MSRQDFLMSQIDLEPIESNYSAEQKQMSLSHANGPHVNSGKIQEQDMVNDGSVNSLD